MGADTAERNVPPLPLLPHFVGEGVLNPPIPLIDEAVDVAAAATDMLMASPRDRNEAILCKITTEDGGAGDEREAVADISSSTSFII